MDLLLGGFKKYVGIITAIIYFVSGLYVSSIWNGYKENKQLKEVQEQAVKQQSINTEVIKTLQDKNLDTEQKYLDLKGVIDEIKVTNVPCTLTDDAVRLWNKSSNAKKRMPSDSTGVTETNPVPNPIEGVGIELAFKSKIEEDKILEDARNQQQAIFDWNKKSYGK